MEVRTIVRIAPIDLIETHFVVHGDLEFSNVGIEGADLQALQSAKFEELELLLWLNWRLVEAVAPISAALMVDNALYLSNLGCQPYLVLPPYVFSRNKPNFCLNP